VAIANRQIVTFSLDPFSLSHPHESVSVRLPLFVLLLLTLALGVLLGGLAAHWSRFRRERARAKLKAALPARSDGPTRPHE
jgi:hypothetical protein